MESSVEPVDLATSAKPQFAGSRMVGRATMMSRLPITDKPLRIGIVAGEASGDLLGSHLVKALKAYIPEGEFVGIGGPKMTEAGVTSLFPMETLAVRGYAEVLRHYFEIVSIRRKLIRYFIDHRPDIFIGVDAPDFNLGVEDRLKEHGIPTVQYVCPAIWAWRAERVHTIRKAVTKVLSIFPFEQPLLEKADIPVAYVGHPLADLLPDNPSRAAMRESMRMPKDNIVFALLPGSRRSELTHMADLFVETARLIAQAQPKAHFLVPLASRETWDLFEAALHRSQAELPMTLLFGHAHDAMIAADAVLAASGTATLEAALLKRPLVITYKMPRLTWWISRRKRYLPYVGLPNILAGELVAPEFIQDEATPEALSRALINLVSDTQAAQRLSDRFTEIRDQLRQNNAEKSAQAILGCLGIKIGTLPQK